METSLVEIECVVDLVVRSFLGFVYIESFSARGGLFMEKEKGENSLERVRLVGFDLFIKCVENVNNLLFLFSIRSSSGFSS